MRALIQRVHSGSVSVRHPELHNHALPPSHPSQPLPESITKIGKGAVVFLGISAEDTLTDCDYVLRKTMSLRLWPDPDDEENKQWTKSLLDLNLDVLFVSHHFTRRVLEREKTILQSSDETKRGDGNVR